MKPEPRTAALAWPDAFGLALALAGDRSRAEDLCQEAWLRLWRRGGEVDWDRPVRPLLLTIVRNLAVDDARRKGATSLDEVRERQGETADPTTRDPAAAAATREEADLVRAALDTLSPIWRATLYLRDGLGLSAGEIADILGNSRETVRVTVHRARQRVRQKLRPTITEATE